MLTSLAVLGDTGFELADTSSNDQDGAIGLGGSRDHVLDEITVTGGVDDGDAILEIKLSTLILNQIETNLVGLELPQGNIDGDTALTLGLELVQNPGVLEGTCVTVLSTILCI